MSNNITQAQTYEAPTPKTISASSIKAGSAISAMIPQTIDDFFRLSKALAVSGNMVPTDFQGKPEMIMAAMLRGAEIGLAPMQALSNIAVINGRASVWGDALPALMQRAGHTIDMELSGQGDNMKATATLTRGDNGQVVVREFSVKDAKTAQLWTKKGPWQQYPNRMLSNRARALAIRDGAADTLMGMQIAEEMHDVTTSKKQEPEIKSGGFAGMAQQARQEQEVVAKEADVVPDAEIQDAEIIPEDEWTLDALDLTQASPVSDEYQEGMDCAIAGQPVQICPHTDDKTKCIDFVAGWNHGMKESEKEANQEAEDADNSSET